MKSASLDLNLTSNLTYRFDLPDDIKLNTLNIVVFSDGTEVPKLNQSRYKVVDIQKNIIDIYFDSNLLDEEFKNSDITYQIFMTSISTIDLGRVEYENKLIYHGKITIS